MLAEEGFGGRRYDAAFARATIEKVAAAIERSLPQAQPVTHLGVGMTHVEKVASNRRILGLDGPVKIMRFSKSTNAEAIAAPEGVIDPSLRAISLWNGHRPLVSMTYYATHPQSYYCDGEVTSDFVGLAGAQRETELPEVFHVHFNGAGGNVAAGKYNDGSPEMRPILAGRLAAGMQRAWKQTVRQPISAADVEWRIEPASLPVAAHREVDQLKKAIAAPEETISERMNGVRKLAWLQRNRAGQTIDVSCLKLKHVSNLHLPGELFVEYQLAAQKMRPHDVVCMAAYGDFGPGYIGTQIAYSQGGYETSRRASNVAPDVEQVLMQAMRRLLK